MLLQKVKILGVVERILKAPFPKLMCAKTKDKIKVPSELETYEVYVILNKCVHQIAKLKKKNNVSFL